MNEIFAEIVKLSLKASWVVLAVLLLRFVLQSAPKWIHCLMWSVVGLRLVVPFSVESVVSLLPSRETVESVVLSGRFGDMLPENLTEIDLIQAESGLSVMAVLGIIWAVGAAAMLVYYAVSYFRMRARIAVSVRYQDNIYFCDDIDKPFIFGVFKPRICLPSGIDEAQMGCIVRHERAHLARKDHWWKPLSFVLLAVYWFNPMLWLAYKLLGQDIELACDEKTVKNMDMAGRKVYSETLLTCGMERKMQLACSVAFGEVGVRERIVSVLSYRKPAFLRTITAAVMCVLLAVCFLTDPVAAKIAKTVDVDVPAAEEQAGDLDGWMLKQEFGNGNASINANGVSIEKPKCCPYVQSAGVEITYSIGGGDNPSNNTARDYFSDYAHEGIQHMHEIGYVYAKVTCRSCGAMVDAYYVGEGYRCSIRADLGEECAYARQYVLENYS